MIYLVYAIHVVTCIFLILVVLLQQGKGADLSVFGGGTTQAAFGARGAATLLHKLTVAFFILFLITTMSIGILQRQRRGSSVMQDVESREAAPLTAPIPPGEAGASGEPAESGAAPAPQTLDGEAAPGTEEAEPPAGQAPAESEAPAPEGAAAEAETAPPPPGG